jgi:hypothetical protein
MGANIEWITPDIGILRLGENFTTHLTYDPYQFTCVVVLRGQRAIFKAGFSDSYVNIVKEHNNVRQLLIPKGIKYAHWERVVNGKLIPRDFKI